MMKDSTENAGNGIELAPDAWERFERAVDTVSKSGPRHRFGSSTPSPQTEKAGHSGARWQELGFDSWPAVLEGQTEPPLPHQEANQTGRRVVAWMREIEGGIELSFDHPTS
jgi:hypothetical protein